MKPKPWDRKWWGVIYLPINGPRLALYVPLNHRVLCFLMEVRCE